VPVPTPNFSPFPFEQLARRSRADAAVESALARWMAVRTSELPTVAKLVGGPVRIESIGIGTRAFDPYSALAEVRLGPLVIVAATSGAAIRALTQRMLGGPAELPAPRPATAAEHAVWTMLLAAALADTGVAGEAWPLADGPRAALERDLVERAKPTKQLVDDAAPLETDDDRETGPVRAIVDDDRATGVMRALVRPREDRIERPRIAIGGRDVVPIELALDAGGIAMIVVAWCPAEIVARVPPKRTPHAWTFELPIVVARCALDRAAVRALAPRDVVVVARELSLELGDGAFRLTPGPKPMEAVIATGYVHRDMAPDAQLELTVRLGTTKLGLQRIGALAVGEVIALNRPLSGPYEIHVAGRKIGEGELIDIDGELGVRIVSLIEE
jgi:hypothetical protein